MYYNCSNCKRDLPEGDMCGDCASFLRPVEVFKVAEVNSDPEHTPKQSKVEKVVKAVKKAVKRKK